MSAYVFVLIIYLSNGSVDVSDISYPTVRECYRASPVLDSGCYTGDQGGCAKHFQCPPLPKSVSEPREVLCIASELHCRSDLAPNETCAANVVTICTDPPEYPRPACKEETP